MLDQSTVLPKVNAEEGEEEDADDDDDDDDDSGGGVDEDEQKERTPDDTAGPLAPTGGTKTMRYRAANRWARDMVS